MMGFPLSRKDQRHVWITRLCLVSVLLWFVLSPLVAGTTTAGRKHKLGDWVEMKVTTEIENKKQEQNIRFEVSNVDGNNLGARSKVTFRGKNQFTREINIPVTADMKPKVSGKKPEIKVEMLGEGDEFISIGGKSYNCHWVKKRNTIKFPEHSIVTIFTEWTNPEVPVNHVVKRIIEQTGRTPFKVTQELVGAGYGK